MYQLTKDGIEFIIHAHRMKTNRSLLYANEIKTVVNSTKNYVIMIVKAKDVEQTEFFKGCDPKLKKGLIKVVFDYDILFQEPKGLPPKRDNTT